MASAAEEAFWFIENQNIYEVLPEFTHPEGTEDQPESNKQWQIFRYVLKVYSAICRNDCKLKLNMRNLSRIQADALISNLLDITIVPVFDGLNDLSKDDPIAQAVVESINTRFGTYSQLTQTPGPDDYVPGVNKMFALQYILQLFPLVNPAVSEYFTDVIVANYIHSPVDLMRAVVVAPKLDGLLALAIITAYMIKVPQEDKIQYEVIRDKIKELHL